MGGQPSGLGYGWVSSKESFILTLFRQITRLVAPASDDTGGSDVYVRPDNAGDRARQQTARGGKILLKVDAT